MKRIKQASEYASRDEMLVIGRDNFLIPEQKYGTYSDSILSK
jgi:hypothetical protein